MFIRTERLYSVALFFFFFFFFFFTVKELGRKDK
jgi:hypothetical protein